MFILPKKHEIIMKKIAGVFNGYDIILVGGYVRDVLIGKEPNDIDFATNATPDIVIKKLKLIADKNLKEEPIVWMMGVRYGTIAAKIEGEVIEVTTFRGKEVYTQDSRKPEVIWGNNFYEDSKRRDFTINAMGYDIIKEELLDYWNGAMGIRTKSISAVGISSQRFTEDPLRMLRAIRLATKLEYNIDPETFNSIEELAEKVQTLSSERKREELTKILTTEHPDEGVRLLVDSGLMQYLIPEINEMINLEQPTQYHDKDVYNHTLKVLANVENEPRLRWAALLHDIGKPKTYTITEDGIIHYYGHQDEGAKIAYQILRRLSFSNEDIAAICHLVRQHMNAHRLTKGLNSEGINTRKIATQKGEEGIDLKTVEKFVNSLDYWRGDKGEEKLLVSAEDVMKLNRADIMGGAPKRVKNGLKKFDMTKKMVETVREMRANPKPRLPINGNDLKERYGLEEGKLLGDVLKHLNEKLMDGEFNESQADKAYSLAQKYLVEEKHHPLNVSPLNGDELIQMFDLQPGKEMGNILKKLKDMVISGEMKAWEKDKAIKKVKEILG